MRKLAWCGRFGRFGLFGLFGLWACGGGGGGSAGDGGLAGCKIVLTGAVHETVPCLATATFDLQSQLSTMGVVGQPLPADLSSVAISFQVAGRPDERDYATEAQLGGATVLTKSNVYFAARVGANPIGTVGSFTISSHTMLTTDQGKEIYQIHGQFDGTLLPATGSDMVTMTITF